MPVEVSEWGWVGMNPGTQGVPICAKTMLKLVLSVCGVVLLCSLVFCDLFVLKSSLLLPGDAERTTLCFIK